MSLIGQVFLKLYTPKDMLIQKHNRACFWKPFGSEQVNESQKLLKSAKKYLYPTFFIIWAILSMEKLFSIRSEILELLDNTLTGNYEYSRCNAENLPLPIQIQLSKKLWTFYGSLLKFLESTWNFQCFQKKKTSLLVQVFLKLLTPKDVLILMHNRASFWKPCGSERVNEFPKFLKSA